MVQWGTPTACMRRSRFASTILMTALSSIALLLTCAAACEAHSATQEPSGRAVRGVTNKQNLPRHRLAGFLADLSCQLQGLLHPGGKHPVASQSSIHVILIRRGLISNHQVLTWCEVDLSFRVLLPVTREERCESDGGGDDVVPSVTQGSDGQVEAHAEVLQRLFTAGAAGGGVTGDEGVDLRALLEDASPTFVLRFDERLRAHWLPVVHTRRAVPCHVALGVDVRHATQERRGCRANAEAGRLEHGACCAWCYFVTVGVDPLAGGHGAHDDSL